MLIYLIRNTKNGKVLIGQTINKEERRRWWEHRRELKAQRHCNPHLQSAWNKYGPDIFTYEVIARTESLKELNRLETYYIVEVYDSMNPKKGYNLTTGGDNCLYSEESKEKMRQSKLGKPGPWRGKKRPDIAAHRFGKNNPNYKHGRRCGDHVRHTELLK